MGIFNDVLFLLILVITAIALLILIAILYFFIPFISELKDLNLEISRTTGDEQRYYKRRRRKLWLSLLPFVKY